MKTIAEVIEAKPISTYRGSPKTLELVREQIKDRWGIKESQRFDPYHDAMTATGWIMAGYRIKKGEKALKSITFIESEDDAGHITQKIRRTVSLFHKRQVEKANSR